jgi:hypothetical protein
MIPILLLLLPTKAQTQPSAQRNAATLDRMLATHKSQQELARYMYEHLRLQRLPYGGLEGKLGFEDSRLGRISKGVSGCSPT